MWHKASSVVSPYHLAAKDSARDVVAFNAFSNRALIAYTTSQPNAHTAISIVNCSHFSHRLKQKNNES